MLAARRGAFVLLTFVLSLFWAGSVSAQDTDFFGTPRARDSRKSPEVWQEKCAGGLSGTAAVSHFGIAGGAAFFSSESSDDWSLEKGAETSCNATIPEAPRTPSRKTAWGDAVPSEVAEQLSALGKGGARIERAREEVLSILRSESACTEWFKTKDANPSTTFESLGFLIDHHGPESTFESQLPNSFLMFRQPYVARATQNSGPFSSVTLNEHGAFYRSQGNVEKALIEGGPTHMDGTRLLTVGPYVGNTLETQMVTLLHEFGHIIDLLPVDADDMDGKSARNTNEVLRHCRVEVEARAKEARQAGKR